MTTHRVSAVSAIALAGALAALASGCAQKPLCPELGSCGGDLPYGSWVLAPGYGSCTEDLYLPATDTRLAGPSNVTPALGAPPEPAVFDWCTLLVTTGRSDNIQAQPPRFYYESGQIGQSELRFHKNPNGDPYHGGFTASLTRTGTFYLDFPAVCVRGFGAQDGMSIDPSNPAAPMGTVCEQLQKPVADSGLGEGSYRNTICKPSASDPQGCLCQFDVTETGGVSGFYNVLSKNTIEFILQGTFPNKVTYCNKGDHLELTAANGDYLFGVRGLRTFKMKFVAADDGTDPSMMMPTPM